MAIPFPRNSKLKGKHYLKLEFEGEKKLMVSFFVCSGYCQQMDTHVPTDTVREALLFSAKLRQPASVPLAEKEA